LRCETDRPESDAHYRQELRRRHPDVGEREDAFDTVEQKYGDATAPVTS
jgi:hypothetical protein